MKSSLCDIIHPLDIGNVHLKNNIILAPMAGVSDLPFRLLCHENGAGLVCGEMVSAKAICFRNKNTEALLKTTSDERPVSIQLFGSDPDSMYEAAKYVAQKPFDIIDINMGCPVPKIVKNGDGSALMLDEGRAKAVISAVVNGVRDSYLDSEWDKVKNEKDSVIIKDYVSNEKSDENDVKREGIKPVTVKIRAGFDDEHLNAPRIAELAEEAGAKVVTVHARTREQFYSGKASWNIIRDVKKSVGIPVIGNGDLGIGNVNTSYRTSNAFTNSTKEILLQSIVKMYEETGCDGFMVGRAARGNPWIFNVVLLTDESMEAEQSTLENNGDGHIIFDESESKKLTRYGVTYETLVDTILRHARLLISEEGEYSAIRKMRKHASWYTEGMNGSATLRKKINSVETYDELEKILSDWIFDEG